MSSYRNASEILQKTPRLPLLVAFIAYIRSFIINDINRLDVCAESRVNVIHRMTRDVTTPKHVLQQTESFRSLSNYRVSNFISFQRFSVQGRIAPTAVQRK